MGTADTGGDKETGGGTSGLTRLGMPCADDDGAGRAAGSLGKVRVSSRASWRTARDGLRTACASKSRKLICSARAMKSAKVR